SLDAFLPALPALGFAVGRSLPFPARELRPTLAAGLLSGLLVAAIAGIRLSWTAPAAFEGPGALLLLFVLGIFSMSWSMRSSVERGREVATHVASGALLVAAGALAVRGVQPAVLTLVVGLAIGLGSGLILTRHGPWWVALLVGFLAFVPSFLSFGAPQRVHQEFSAFSAGALLSALLLLDARPQPRSWWIVAGAALFALVPSLLAMG